MAALNPTEMLLVPRLLTRFNDVFKSKIEALPEPQKEGIQKAIAAKLQIMKATGKHVHEEIDAKAMVNFKAALGGRAKNLITGSAPVASDILDFMKVTLCSPIREGYGQTETTAAATATFANDPESGHVGGPYPCCYVKLVDVPDMHYLTTDICAETGVSMPRGEICFKGPSVFSGYFMNE